MAKMTKAQMRKRLNEASGKVGNVALEVYNNPSSTSLTPKDAKDLTLVLNTLRKVVNRLK